MRCHFSNVILNCIVALTVASSVPASGGFANEKRPSPGDNDTPEQAIREFIAAARAGNLEAFLGRLAAPLRRFAQAEIRIGDAETAFQAALDKQFGKGPAPSRFFTNAAERRETIKALKDIRILEKQIKAKDRVQLTVWEIQDRSPEKDRVVETRVVAVREEKGWKLFYYRIFGTARGERKTRKGPDGKEIEVYVENVESGWDPSKEPRLAAAEKLVGTFEAIVKEVAGGKFKTRKEAERVWQSAQDTAFRQQKPE
jgi:hypothetical protein